MASPLTTRLKGLNPKHYILAVLMATLAAAVVVTVFFVVLSPARMYFSVINPSSHVWKEDGGVDLNFTLAANNTSHRAAVWYHTILVDVSNNTGPSSSDSLVWTSAVITNTSAIMSRWQPHGSVVTVNLTVSAPGDPWTKSFITGDDMNSSTFTVRVIAVVRFKVGIARTRLYDINVICSPVSFLPRNGKGHVRVVPPVGCVPS